MNNHSDNIYTALIILLIIIFVTAFAYLFYREYKIESNIELKKCDRYIYAPQKDITTYELSLMIQHLPVIGIVDPPLDKTSYWNDIKRHYRRPFGCKDIE